MKLEKLTADFGTILLRDGFKTLDDLSVEECRKLIQTTGAVVFRNYNPTKEKFIEFSDRFSTKMLKHAFKSIRKSISADGTIAEVLTGNHEVEPHGEMYYRPNPRPDILWLYCVKPSPVLGATTVCDGVAVFENLSASAKKFFIENKIVYEHISMPSAWQVFAETTNIEEAMARLRNAEGVSNVSAMENGFVRWDYTTSGLVKVNGKFAFVNSIRNVLQGQRPEQNSITIRFEKGGEIPKAILDDVYQAAAKVLYPVQWNPGDILAVDNTRMMHGRQRFEGDRLIFTRFSLAS